MLILVAQNIYIYIHIRLYNYTYICLSCMHVNWFWIWWYYNIYIYRYYILVYIYIWSPPPPGPTFSHPRRGRCHRDIYNKIVHSTETMEKTVKNEHLSKRKLICTESKNCCKSVLFRPKFGLESHGLKYIWYPPPQVLKWDVRSKMIAKLSVSIIIIETLVYIYI